MRDTPRGIVEELREGAAADAAEMRLAKEQMPGWEAADYIDHLTEALSRIAEGEPSPEGIAKDALDPVKWMLSGEEPVTPHLLPETGSGPVAPDPRRTDEPIPAPPRRPTARS